MPRFLAGLTAGLLMALAIFIMLPSIVASRPSPIVVDTKPCPVIVPANAHPSERFLCKKT